LLKKQVFSALLDLCVRRDLCARLLWWCGCDFDALCNLRFLSHLRDLKSVSSLVFIQLVLLSWLSHAAAVVGPFSWLQLGNDIVHLTSVAIWPGALVPLWLFSKQPAPELIKRDALLRFSNVAVVLLVVARLVLLPPPEG
jgi:putative copper export protein